MLLRFSVIVHVIMLTRYAKSYLRFHRMTWRLNLWPNIVPVISDSQVVIILYVENPNTWRETILLNYLSLHLNENWVLRIFKESLTIFISHGNGHRLMADAPSRPNFF